MKPLNKPLKMIVSKTIENHMLTPEIKIDSEIDSGQNNS